MLNSSEPNELRKPNANVRYVSTPTELVLACEALAKLDGPIAVDAERASGFKYSQRAYLVQLYRRGGEILLVDPITAIDSQEAYSALSNAVSGQEWILHASSQDVPCLREIGLVAGRIYDTELGSRILGLPRVGLGAVVEHFLGVKLAKEHSAVDWSTRPLADDWLDYAALDVEVLPDLWDALQLALKNAEKLDWAFQEFEPLPSFHPREKSQERWRSISGAHEIRDQRQLAIVREMFEARDNLAQKMDIAAGRLIPDSSIIAAAKTIARSRSELLGNRAFSGRASRTYIDLWWDAVQRGSNTLDLPALRLPAVGIPNHRIWPQKFPEADARLKSARKSITELSEELQIPAENILQPDALRAVCFDLSLLDGDSIAERLANLGARKWQIELTAQRLAQSFTEQKDSDGQQTAQQPASIQPKV